jgi:phosphoribosylformylglycinamidine synthase subunit PurQ / glutaminase
MKFGVIIFPGSNCDHDCYYAVQAVLGKPVEFIWHQETTLNGFDAVILPGGFSYGDYLRTGALAKFSPVMGAVKDFAGKGGLVIGICNGFQILAEAGLLPGALMRNVSQKYICKFLKLSVGTTNSPFTSQLQKGQILNIPIGHGDGNYFADEETLKRLKGEDQIAFRYHDENPNGSVENIAGILNAGRNVLGMMPHPDRSSEQILGSADGKQIFESMVNALAGAR